MIKIKYLPLAVLFLLFTGCTLSDEEKFGGIISGKVVEENDSIVPGDITSNTLLIYLQGENDISPLFMRVKGDGTYQNVNLYPQNYKVWLSGPIANSDTFNIDISGSVVKKITVKPYLSIKNRQVSQSSNSVTVKYTIKENTDKSVTQREIYCSTVMFPTGQIGSGPYYSTKKISLPNNEGEITIPNLNSGNSYYIRIGAKVNNQQMNYSSQIKVTI